MRRPFPLLLNYSFIQCLLTCSSSSCRPSWHLLDGHRVADSIGHQLACLVTVKTRRTLARCFSGEVPTLCAIKGLLCLRRSNQLRDIELLLSYLSLTTARRSSSGGTVPDNCYRRPRVGVRQVQGGLRRHLATSVAIGEKVAELLAVGRAFD